MNKQYILILALSLSACGHYSSDPAFNDHVTAFREMLAHQNVADYAQRWNVELKFGTPRTSLTAECRAGDVQREVIVDPEMWGQLSEIERRVLIFHELGHCVLGRVHVPGAQYTNDGHIVTDSLMYPNAVSSADGYQKDPERYDMELTLYAAKNF